MITIFDDDFDKADHIGEIRKIHTPVPVLPSPPAAEPTKQGPDAFDEFPVAPMFMAGITINGEAIIWNGEEVKTPQKPAGGNPARDAARRVLARFGRGEA